MNAGQKYTVSDVMEVLRGDATSWWSYAPDGDDLAETYITEAVSRGLDIRIEPDGDERLITIYNGGVLLIWSTPEGTVLRFGYEELPEAEHRWTDATDAHCFILHDITPGEDPT